MGAGQRPRRLSDPWLVSEVARQKVSPSGPDLALLGGMRTPLLLGLLLLAGLLLPARASADGYEETEQRLKSAGIDETMRLEIHDAIRKGVAVLRKQQFKNGSILGNAGQTVLGGLALRHAGIPEGEQGGRAALGFIMRYMRKQVRERTYEAGLACMLLQSLAVEGKEHKYLLQIHDRLRKGPRNDLGYWGYNSAGGVPPGNLSTAQFACLGLWAAERAGAKTAEKAWRLHLDTLLKAQRPGGSWAYYAPDDKAFRPMMQPYPTGTFMGLANIALASEALKESIEADAELNARVRTALLKGRAALRRHALRILSAPRVHGLQGLGFMPFYRLYALEKACIFMDLEDVGGVAWYRAGARWLLNRQLPKTGGWNSSRPAGVDPRSQASKPSAQDTAFALLFLLRSSAAYHPVTPRPIARAPVITPSGEEELEETPEEPGSAAPPLMLVGPVIDQLEKALELKRLSEIRKVVRSLRLAGRFYRSSRTADGFASPGHEMWARRLDAAVLKLALRFRTAKANDRVIWHAVSLEALKTLGELHPRVGPRLMKAAETLTYDKSFPTGYQFGWYATAFESLRRLKVPGLANWLGERVLSVEPKHWWRTAAALTTLSGMAPSVPGRKRHGIARSTWRHLVALSRRSSGNPQAADLMRDLQVLMFRLAAPGGDTDLPSLGTLDPSDAVKRLEAWWRHHDKPDDPLWR